MMVAYDKAASIGDGVNSKTTVVPKIGEVFLYDGMGNSENSGQAERWTA